MVLRFAHDDFAARTPMQRVTDFQQHSFPVSPPLMIPEPHLLDAFLDEKLLPGLVALALLRHPVLRTVQLDGELRGRTIKIEVEGARRMLTAKLKSREASSSQRAPQLLFLIRLLATQTPRVGDGIHALEIMFSKAKDKASGEPPLLRSERRRGPGRGGTQRRSD